MDERIRRALAPWQPPAEIEPRLLTPALAIDLDRVRQNLAWMRARMGDDLTRWRPHVKTSKIPIVLAEFLALGIRQFKCATTREASVLLQTARDRDAEPLDVLLAHPARGPSLARLAEVARRFPTSKLSVLVEDEEVLRELPEPLDAFLDLDPGMHRTGIPPTDNARIEHLAAGLGERFRGLHFYDGHLHGGDVERRRRAAHEGYDRLLRVVERLTALGTPPRELITSGTPTFPHALDHDGLSSCSAVHRVSPGTVVFHDTRSIEDLPELDLRPAAFVLSRVISHPGAGRATCDAGSKSLAAEAGDPCAVVLGHPEWRAAKPSEEHLPLIIGEQPPPARGTLLVLVPRHVCPTVNLAEQALIVEGDTLRETAWVAARAHELLRPD